MQEKLTVPTGKNDHIQGDDNAPLEIVEYGDYQCPYCGMAYPIIKQVQKELGKKVKLIFRNFPLSQMHPNAMNAAGAAEAAAKQGKFWEMHDKLYENQESLEPLDLDRYAQELDLNMNQFGKDLSSPEVANRIDSDFNSGMHLGVNGTPTFFVNGVRYDGDWELKPFLDFLRHSAAQRPLTTNNIYQS